MRLVCSALLFALLATTAGAGSPAAEGISRGRPVDRAPAEGIGPCGTDICDTSEPHACIEVTNAETAWRTCISNQGRRGLVLGPTDLRRTRSGPWMRVLREAGIADIFVPYHGLDLRLYDNETTSAESIREVSPDHAGRQGTA